MPSLSSVALLLSDSPELLLDTALKKMNAPDHQYSGKLLHDGLMGSLELCCGRGSAPWTQ